jgi:CheY-like chemotaxis protein
VGRRIFRREARVGDTGVQTILVVDDEYGVVDVLLAALEDEGYRVVVAANGKRGLAQLTEHKPDLIITDFMMPILDGAALGAAVRGDPQFKDIPIIMTSSVPEASIRARFNGYSAYLRKPFRLGELIDCVKALL